MIYRQNSKSLYQQRKTKQLSDQREVLFHLELRQATAPKHKPLTCLEVLPSFAFKQPQNYYVETKGKYSSIKGNMMFLLLLYFMEQEALNITKTIGRPHTDSPPWISSESSLARHWGIRPLWSKVCDKSKYVIFLKYISKNLVPNHNTKKVLIERYFKIFSWCVEWAIH